MHSSVLPATPDSRLQPSLAPDRRAVPRALNEASVSVTLAVFLLEDPSLGRWRVDIFRLLFCSGRKARIEGRAVNVTAALHLFDQRFVTVVECAQLAGPPHGFRVAAVTLLALSEDVP